MSDGVGIEIKMKAVADLRVKMKRFIPAFRRAEEAAIKRSGDQMLQSVRFFASGNGGGPQVETGVYLSSINLTTFATGWTVRTAAAQARRLEYGFVGTDSLGREYAQAPRPHWRPATMLARQGAVRELRSLPIAVWKGQR